MESEKKGWLYAGLALVAGVGLVLMSSPAEAGPTSPVRLPASPRVLIIGDSLAVGLGPVLKKLASGKSVGLAYDGKVGTTSQQWATNSWLATDLGRDKFDVVLVSLGTNDMPTGASAAQIQQHMLRVVQAIQAAGAQPVWVSPPTMPTLREQEVRAAIAALGIPVFPSEALSISRGGDKIHPTATGYAGWAGALFSWLVP